jgi:hypothetical protein
MTELMTNSRLLSALKRASGHVPTAEELHKQRVSFILGTISDCDTVTRERVEAVLAAHEGKKPIGDPV